MFGLTKREQRWAAEQKAAETILGFLSEVVAAEVASAASAAIAARWQPTTAALTALKQFSQDCPHNLPAHTLYTLAAIGLLYKNRASHYSITDYGNSVLAAAMAAP